VTSNAERWNTLLALVRIFVHSSARSAVYKDPCQGKKCITFFSIGSHLHQNSQTNFMPPERIRLFLQIFFKQAATLTSCAILYKFSTKYCFSVLYRHLSISRYLSRHSINFFVSQTWCHKRPQPISCLDENDDPIKPRSFILLFHSSDDFWKVLNENVRIFNSLFQEYSNQKKWIRFSKLF